MNVRAHVSSIQSSPERSVPSDSAMFQRRPMRPALS